MTIIGGNNPQTTGYVEQDNSEQDNPSKPRDDEESSSGKHPRFPNREEAADYYKERYSSDNVTHGTPEFDSREDAAEYYRNRYSSPDRFEDYRNEDSRNNDSRYEDSRNDDSRYDDSRNDDSRYDDSRNEDSRYDDSRNEDSRYDDSRNDDSRYDDSRNEDSRYDDSRNEDSRYDDSRNEDSRYDDSRNEDSRYDDSRNEDKKYPSSEALDPSEKYSAEDLEALGLDSNLATYITELFGHKLGGSEYKITGANLLKLEEDGHLEISPTGDEISVAFNPNDGFSAYELLASTELTGKEVDFLIYEIGDKRSISQDVYEKYINDDGTLSDHGKRQMGDKAFDGNPVSLEDAKITFDENSTFTQEDLESLGLSESVAEHLTKEGSISGPDIIEKIEDKSLKAGKVDGEIQLRTVGNAQSPPANGLSLLALLDSGLSKEEAHWLMDSFGLDERISPKDIKKYLDTSELGMAKLNEKAREQFELGKKDEASLMEDGATYEELIALGFSSADTNYLIAYHGEEGKKSISQDSLEKLKEDGFVVPDPDKTDPPRYMFQGEGGISAEDADTKAKEFAAGADPNASVVTIGPDGTGNFYSAGTHKTGPAASVNLEQSVIFSRKKNEDGTPVGNYEGNNGNAQGLYDKNNLKDLGFSDRHVDAIFKDAKDPELLTMSELKNAIKNNAGDSGSVAEVVDQAVIMRQPGDPKYAEQELKPSPFAPSKQEAQWLNEKFGAGNGLSETELADALEAGVVQIIDGRLLMTAHGKSVAFAEKGPTDGDINSHQKKLLREAFRDEFAPNGEGATRSINLDTMMSKFNGNLSKADANLILQTFGDGEKISQEQLDKAIEENKVIISEKKEGAEGSAYSLKITPTGYEDMAADILKDPENPYTKKINGILNFPDNQKLESINVEQLEKNHGLSKEDAYALVTQYDLSGDGTLSPEELLQALLNDSIVLDDANKITEVKIDKSDAIKSGPYTAELLAEKIQSGDEKLPSKDLANAIFLHYGIDPKNSKEKLTDEQVENWVRENPYMTEDANGVLKVAEDKGEKPDPNAVYEKLRSGNDGVVKMPHNDDREASKDTRYKNSQWKSESTLSRGDTYLLANYLHQDGMGHLGKSDKRTEVKSTDLHLSKENITTLVNDGILTLDGDGKVALTLKGQAIVDAKAAKDTMALFDKVEENGDIKIDDKGNRFIPMNHWTDDKKYQEGKWEWRSRELQIDNGFDPGKDGGSSIGGFHWALHEGYEHVVVNPDHEKNTVQHESIKMD